MLDFEMVHVKQSNRMLLTHIYLHTNGLKCYLVCAWSVWNIIHASALGMIWKWKWHAHTLYVGWETGWIYAGLLSQCECLKSCSSREVVVLKQSKLLRLNSKSQNFVMISDEDVMLEIFSRVTDSAIRWYAACWKHSYFPLPMCKCSCK